MMIILMIRQEAIDYMLANTAWGREEVEKEVKHYFEDLFAFFFKFFNLFFFLIILNFLWRER